MARIALVETYLHQTEFTARARKELMLAGLTDEESLWQPQPGIPPITWHVGHIAVTEASLFLGMGKGMWDEIDEAWIQTFSMGAALPDPITELPPLSQVLPEAARLRKRCVKHVLSLSEEDLGRKLPHRQDEMPDFLQTYADCLRSLGLHEGHHNGEISLLRRLLGRPGPF